MRISNITKRIQRILQLIGLAVNSRMGAIVNIGIYTPHPIYKHEGQCNGICIDF